MAGFEDYAPTAGNILTAVYNSWQQGRFARRNEQWAREDATTAFNRQRQLLDEQRAYESPKAQMQRYIDAGLNPNLIYGQQQGSISPPSVPQATSASTDFSPLPSGMFNSILESKLLNAQIERLQNQNSNDDKRTENDVANGLSQRGLNQASIDNLRASINLLSAETEKTIIGSMLLSEQRRAQALDNTFKMVTMDDAIKKFAAETNRSVTESRMIGKYLGAQIMGLKSQAHLNYRLASQADAVAQLYRQEFNINSNDYLMRTGLSVGGKVVAKNRFNEYWNSISQGYQTTFDNARIFKKSADLIEKFGDSEHFLQLQVLGSEFLKNVADAATDFMPMFNKPKSVSGFGAGLRR